MNKKSSTPGRKPGRKEKDKGQGQSPEFLSRDEVSTKWKQHLKITLPVYQKLSENIPAVADLLASAEEKPEKIYDIYSKGVFAAAKYRLQQKKSAEIKKLMQETINMNYQEKIISYISRVDEPCFSIPKKLAEGVSNSFQLEYEGQGYKTLGIECLSFTHKRVEIEEVLYFVENEKIEPPPSMLNILGIEGCRAIKGKDFPITVPYEWSIRLRDMDQYSHLAGAAYFYHINWLGALLDLIMRLGYIPQSIIHRRRGIAHNLTPYIKVYGDVKCPVPISIGERDIIVNAEDLISFSTTFDEAIPDKDIATIFGLYHLLEIGPQYGIPLSHFKDTIEESIPWRFLKDFPGDITVLKYRSVFKKDKVIKELNSTLVTNLIHTGYKQMVSEAIQLGLITLETLKDQVEPKILHELGFDFEAQVEELPETPTHEEIDFTNLFMNIPLQSQYGVEKETKVEKEDVSFPPEVEPFFLWEREEGFNSERGRAFAFPHFPFDPG